ncbi:MAG: DVUA0089 family protein [Myxococcaceae bacterium]|nr:DVUA0089 family protein [Myxococcaceae bacterium]
MPASSTSRWWGLCSLCLVLLACPASGPAVCGDGVRADAEACDDGNTNDGDGCSAGCEVQPTPVTPCGDGVVAADEACDDGNRTTGDGCSAACVVEAGFSCAGAPSQCTTRCGDGITAGAEGCDDANTGAGDGCTASCAVEPGFSCGGAPSVCVAGCGDGRVNAPETCDDGNLVAGDGCAATCQREAGFTCMGEPSRCQAACGDGVVAATEGCDDGNQTAMDGCSPACRAEPGFTCTGSPSRCESGCGDGVVAGTEACDDANATTGDGCAACQLEPGFTCSGAPSVCATVCGDGRVGGLERCDDGNMTPGDGCSAGCEPEPGFVCTGTPSVCAPRCGDGLLTGNEQCDDGNLVATDGCDASCRTTAGFTCMGAPSVCVTRCGDGITAGQEACDDMNQTRFDGCDACRVDRFDESEPNGTAAQADGPFPVEVAVRASIGPQADDLDLFTIRLTATTSLTLETFDEAGPGRCRNIDTVVTLYGPGGTVTLASDDDSGLDRCSRLSARDVPALRRLAPGDYLVEVRAFAAFRQIPEYRLVITADATCGNARLEPFEACDAPTGCTPACERVPTCGDGFVDGAERCDDGNTMPGDGCDGACAFEVRAEAEPNGAPSQASGPFAVDAVLAGALAPAGDRDVFALTLTRRADLRIETFDATGPGSCTGIDTVITLFAADGTTVIASRDQGGLGNCAALDPTRAADAAVRQLPPGTYYLRVNEFLDDATIAGYRVRITQTSRCGNGFVEGAEACDGAAGCTAQCTRVPSCGDGFVDGPETCDDGNTLANDGCSSTCASESVLESEPNNTAATAGMARAPFVQFQGSIGTPTDLDFFAITVPAAGDLAVETFDPSGPTSCADMDTTLTLFAPNGTTVLLTKQGGGPGLCAAIDPKTDVAARQLPAGTYFVRVEDAGQNTTIPAYLLRARLESRCGNQTVEGFEACDGAAGCTPTCRFAEVCGNGFVEGSERCDDGNAVAGDGCSAACGIERLEQEPNGTLAEAQAQAVVAVPGWARGAITAGDVDTWRLVVASPQVVQLELFDTSASGCALQTSMAVLDSAGATLWADDNSGVASCSAVTVLLPAGTFFVQVRGRTATTAFTEYLLALRSASPASEAEPNELRSQATALSGTNVVVVGAHLQNLDIDVFSIAVPPGRSLRVEAIEGGAETCESNGVDTFVTLSDAAGLALGWDDDSGRGACSRIDGTGQLAVSPWASRLVGGVYYLQVEAAPFAQMANDPAGQFDYRLVISIR